MISCRYYNCCFLITFTYFMSEIQRQDHSVLTKEIKSNILNHKTKIEPKRECAKSRAMAALISVSQAYE